MTHVKNFCIEINFLLVKLILNNLVFQNIFQISIKLVDFGF